MKTKALFMLIPEDQSQLPAARSKAAAISSAMFTPVCPSAVQFRLSRIGSWWECGWKINNWKTSSKKSVKNKELWIELYNESQKHNIEWKWVKGHSGHPENEIADMLANQAIDENY